MRETLVLVSLQGTNSVSDVENLNLRGKCGDIFLWRCYGQSTLQRAILGPRKVRRACLIFIPTARLEYILMIMHRKWTPLGAMRLHPLTGKLPRLALLHCTL